jgi:hypothetical protein
MYKILPYTKAKAKQHNVTVKPSTNKRKKIDVYEDGIKIASIGGYGWKDYAIYLKENGKEYADKRQLLYKSRHRKDINNIGSNGWWANVLLW